MPNSSTRTPESSYTNNNNDYFTYISASQQNHRLASPNPNESSNEDRPIPEIRLAPPNLEEQQQQPLDNVSIHVPFKNQDELKISVSMSMVVDDVCCTLFPTLQDWSSKTAFAKLSALVAVPLVLIFTLTLPVAEGDEVKVDDIEVLAPATTTTNEPQTNQQIVVITSSSAGEGETPTRATAPAASKSYLTVPTSERSISELNTDEDLPLLIEEDEGQLGWCRWLVAVQAVCATTFVTSVMACKSRFALNIDTDR